MKVQRAALGVITANQNIEPVLAVEKKGITRKLTDLVQTTKGVVQNERNSGKRRRLDEGTVRQSKKQRLLTAATLHHSDNICETNVLIVPAAPCDEAAINDPNQFPEYASMIQKFAEKMDEQSKKELFNGKTLLESMLSVQSVQTIISFRPLVLNWLAEICCKLQLYDETFHRSCVIFDRMLASRKVNPGSIQRVGISSLLIAMKVEETFPFDVRELESITQKKITVDEIRDEEVKILNTLQFDLGFLTPLGHLDRIVRLIGLPPKYVALAQYLLEVVIISKLPTEHEVAVASQSTDPTEKELLKASPLLMFAPSRVASAAAHLTCRIFKGELKRLGVCIPVLLETISPPATLNAISVPAAPKISADDLENESDSSSSSIDVKGRSASTSTTASDSSCVKIELNASISVEKGVSNLVGDQLAPLPVTRGEASNMALPLMRSSTATSVKIGGKFCGNPAKPHDDPSNDESRPENWGPYLESHTGWTKSELLEVETAIVSTLRALRKFKNDAADPKETKKDPLLEQRLMAEMDADLKPFLYVKKKFAETQKFEWSLIDFG